MSFINQVRINNNQKLRIFGKNLRVLRTCKGLSHKELAEMIGRTPTMISMYENGKTFPRRQILNKLAEILNVSVDELLNEDIFCPYCGAIMRNKID